MPLAQNDLYNNDTAKAVNEVLENSISLYMGGYFNEAVAILQYIATDEAWNVASRGTFSHRIEQMWPLFHWAAGQPCARYGEYPAQSVEVLQSWQEDASEEALQWLVTVNAMVQTDEVGTRWHDGFVQTLSDEMPKGGSYMDTVSFVSKEVELILKMRLKKRLGIDDRMRDMFGGGALTVLMQTPGVSNLPTPIAGLLDQAEGVRESAYAAACDIKTLESIFFEAVEKMCDGIQRQQKLPVDEKQRLSGHLLNDVLMLFVAHYLLDDQPAQATALLAKAIAAPSVQAPNHQNLFAWPPLKVYFATQALTSALQLDDQSVTAYVEAVKSRQPETVAPVMKATDVNWQAMIDGYRQKPKAYAEEYCAEYFEVRSPGLEAISERDDIVSESGATDEAIAAAEKRLGVTLPASYKAFLKTTDGMLMPDTFFDLFPVEEIDWFYTLEQEWVDIWEEGAQEDTPDERHFIYGADQDPCHVHTGFMRHTLQISNTMEGDVLLLNPKVTDGDEWEAWYFGNSHPGAYRYKSFAAMMQSLLSSDKTF